MVAIFPLKQKNNQSWHIPKISPFLLRSYLVSIFFYKNILVRLPPNFNGSPQLQPQLHGSWRLSHELLQPRPAPSANCRHHCGRWRAPRPRLWGRGDIIAPRLADHGTLSFLDTEAVLFSWSKRERDGRGWESLARRVRLVRSEKLLPRII